MNSPLRLQLLRLLLALDAAVLVVLGGSLIAIPTRVGMAFGFIGMAPAEVYLIGLWGCALMSLGLGYAGAIADPLRNINWVRAGILRGVLECALGFSMVNRNILSWNQVALGTILAGMITASYLLLYPWKAAAV